VRVACFVGRSDARSKNLTRLFNPLCTDQQLAIHLITRNVTGVGLKKRAKVLVCSIGIAAIHAFESQAVSREGVVGLLGNKSFKHLAARFLLYWRLFAHLFVQVIRTSRIIRVFGKAAKHGK